MTENELTLEDAEKKVKEQEDSIKLLISPQNLTHQDIDSWDNVNVDKLKDEIGMGMGDAFTYGINHPYGDMIKELAVNQYVDDLDQIRFDYLVFDNIEDCVVRGIWPYGSELGDDNPTKEDITEIVWENKEDIEFFHEYERDMMEQIESAIVEARLKGIDE